MAGLHRSVQIGAAAVLVCAALLFFNLQLALAAEVFIVGLFAYQITFLPRDTSLGDVLVLVLILAWATSELVQKHRLAIDGMDVAFIIFGIAIVTGSMLGATVWRFTGAWLGEAEAFSYAMLYFPAKAVFLRNTAAFQSTVIVPWCVAAALAGTFLLATGLTHSGLTLDLVQPSHIRLRDIAGVTNGVSTTAQVGFAVTPAFFIWILLSDTKAVKVRASAHHTRLGIVCAGQRAQWRANSVACGGRQHRHLWGLPCRRQCEEALAPPARGGYQYRSGQLCVQPCTVAVASRLRTYTDQPDFSPGDLATHGIEHRINEARAFLGLFHSSPLVGAGLGSQVEFYSPVFYSDVIRTNWHVDYTALLGKLGLLGFLPFMTALLLLARHSLMAVRRLPHSQERDLTAAVLASAASLYCFVAFLHPMPFMPDGWMFFAMVTAFVSAQRKKLKEAEAMQRTTKERAVTLSAQLVRPG
ncbi:MAG: hypothetical protein M1118_12390 [Chloroflexi bacterium]|nr:hypothetical protein [Chloroflexota bacterium]